MSTDDAALHDAVNDFANVFSDSLLACHIAEKLRCVELESLATLLEAAGRSDVAEMWRESHAWGDDQDDAHYMGSEEAKPCPIL